MEDVMNFDMPKAVFCGLALIAAAIFFGPGSVPASASYGIQKIAICDAKNSSHCLKVGWNDSVR
jgi:hypothetical protein